MVEWRNTVSGNVTGPVVQAARIDAVYLPGSTAPVDGPPLNSWRDRPELPDALRDLLAAQCSVMEALPYKLLRVKQPKLRQVYVQQTMRTQTTQIESGERTKPQTDGGERTMAVAEALNRNGHLMITGEPGSGKSTVGYMYVQQIADYWLNARDDEPPLTEPVLPLRIPARALAANKVWAELLAAGAEEALGRLLSTRPAAGLFARRALGARWLVFVDGLDEIIEPDTRALVIDAIAHQIRRGVHQRLVITTRPLAGNELKSLERAGVERYDIQPFGPVELEDFARAWFQEQTPITARTRADEFVRQVRDSRLRELVRNPLLATIAAIAYTVEPNRPLPNSRVDLYARFMTYLFDEHASRRDTLSELRKSLAGQPARVALAEWLHERRIELVERLAVHRLENESPLLDAAYEWVLANYPSLPEAWQDDVGSVLDSTGVFVPADGSLRFRHHSFAEFLAARRRAGEIPADFPDLDEWITRGLSGASQVFALFTFVLWGREDHDLSRVFTTLLAGTREKVLLAGRLLAETTVDADLSAAVVNRLLDLLLANGVRTDPWSEVEEVGEVLGWVLPKVLGDAVLERLRDLRDAPELAEAIRLECAVVLGRLTDPETAATWLAEFAETAGWSAVARTAKVLPDLVSGGVERSERLLVPMADDALSTLTVISLLQDLDRHVPARRLIHSLYERLRDRPSRLLPLGDTRLADEVDDDPPGWGVLAGLAARSDCQVEALWAAEQALAQPDITEQDLGGAVQALLVVKGADGVAEAVSSVSGRPIRHLLKAATALREENQFDGAITLVRKAMAYPHIDPFDFSRAATEFVECGVAAELPHIVDECPHLTAKHLVRLPVTPETRHHVRLALNEVDLDPWDLKGAAEALLDPDEPATAEEIRDVARRHGPAHWGLAAVTLFEANYAELGAELFRDMLARGTTTSALDDILIVIASRRFELMDELLSAVRTMARDAKSSWMERFVGTLAGAGRIEDAVILARELFVANLDSGWLSSLVDKWLKAGGVAVGDDILAAMAERDIPAEQRMEIADELASQGLLEAAVKLWLDVVRYHGEAVSHGIAAASCLVRCGHRDQALGTVDQALAGSISAPAKARLIALRAWMLA